MLATVVYANNPFKANKNREVVHIKRKRRISTLAPKRSEPFVCLVNGKPLLRKNNGWNVTVNDKDLVVFLTLPQDGGGDSNPLKVILAIAISVIAPQMAVGILGSVAGTTTLGGLTMLGSVVSAGISFVGNAIVNALIRDPSPSLSNRSIASMQAASPTYNISGQGNQARIGQAIPVIYGRNMIYMDFAAQPYTEFAGNEQYLFQLFVIGQGEYDVEQLRLEDTVIENDVIQDGAVHNATGSFEEIEYQICYNQNVTLFPANVSNSVEVAGQEVKSVSGTYSQSGTTITVTKTGHGLSATEPVYLGITSGSAVSDFFNVATVTSADVFTVTASASLTTSGSVILGDVIGSFVANPADTLATALSYDVVLPRGLYYANDAGGLDTVSVSFAGQYREIDNSGATVGSWVTGFTQTVSLATTTPQRFSYRVGVASGRYECRFARTNLKSTDTRTGNDVNWGGLRAYLAGVQNYGSITMLAMRMKASNQLNAQSSRRINAVVTRKLPIWDGATWSNAEVTRNPAWAFADIATSSYGMNLATTRIDGDQLLALASVWGARGDNFDAIYDGQQPAWEALTQVSRVGRAMPYLQQGNVNITRDAEEVTPVAMFTMRNIAKGSFNLSYLLPNEETADAIDVEYWDNGTFQQKVVRASLAGSTESVVIKRQLFGCSSRAQAYREGMYMAACNRYRRRLLSFQTEMEGYLPTVGDLIAVQHDMPQWGKSGEVINYDDVTRTVTLSEIANTATGEFLLEDYSGAISLEDLTGNLAQEYTASGNYYIAFRNRIGGATDSYSVTLTNNAYQVILNETPSITPDFGIDRERTHYAFGLADSLYVNAKVLGVKPRSLERVEISCVVDSDFVYNADTGAVPTESAWQLPTRITVPVLRGLLARSDPADVTKMYLSWQPSAGADRYLIEVSDNGNGWTRIGETSVSNYTAIASYGARTVVRIAPIGTTRGAWVSVQYGSSADYMWSVTDTDLMWNAVTTTPMWG